MTHWKEKILAFTHGPPGKTRDSGVIYDQRVGSYLSRVFSRSSGAAYQPDPDASAYDLFLPDDQQGPGVASADHLETKPNFVHPFTGQKLPLADSDPATFGDSIGRALTAFPRTDEATQFWLLWRAWQTLSKTCASEAKAGAEALSYMPADVRLPNHTFWSHRSIMSALEATRGADGKLRPAFLMFHAGPVKEIIAQAQNMGDLWSGGFLISWMMAHAMKVLTDQLGPDCVISPFLRGQPLFDWLHRDLLTRAVVVPDGRQAKSVWQELGLAEAAAQGKPLVPSLPNQFLAIVPEGFEVTLIVDEFNPAAKTSAWHRICGSCWAWLLEGGVVLGPEKRRLWDYQVRNFWRLSWQVWPWSELVENRGASGSVIREQGSNSAAASLTAQASPANRQPESGSQRQRRGGEWSTHYGLVAHRLNARRQTREFAAWSANPGLPKDSLSGKEEALVDGARLKAAGQGDRLAHLIRKNEKLGALNLIRRIWPQAVLGPLGLRPESAGLGSLAELPESVSSLTGATRSEKAHVEPPHVGCYGDLKRKEQGYAVLALEADDIARWLAAEKSPKPSEMLSAAAAQSLRDAAGAELDEWLDSPAAFLPSVHLHFSEALANFSLYCARRIVEAHHGQLVFAGGDNVLARLPVAEAIECAAGLRLAFQGSTELPARYARFFAPTYPGFVKLREGTIEEGGRLESEPAWPLMVPGERATVSVGIAMGGGRPPLGEMVQQAQAAVKGAKARLGKDSLVIAWGDQSGLKVWCSVRFGSAAFDLLTLLTECEGAIGDSSTPRMYSGFRKRVMRSLEKLSIDEPLSGELAELVLAELSYLIEESAVRRKKACNDAASAQVYAELLQKARDCLHEFQGLNEVRTPGRQTVGGNGRTARLREFYSLFVLADSIHR